MHSFLVSSTHLSDTPAHSAHPPPTHCLLRLSKEGNKRLSIGEAWQYQFFLQNFQGGWGDHFLFVEAKLDCEMPKHVKNCNFFKLKLAPQGRISSLIFNWLYLWFRSGLAFLSWLNALSHRIFFLYMTNVENSEITPHMEKFEIYRTQIVCIQWHRYALTFHGQR